MAVHLQVAWYHRQRMKKTGLLVIVLTACGGGTDVDSPSVDSGVSPEVDAASDPGPSPFVGAWLVSEFQGEPVSDSNTWTYTDNQVALVFGNEGGYSGTFAINALATPREIDLFFDGLDPVLGIYQVQADGSLLMKNDDNQSGVRPTDFTVPQSEDEREDTDHLLFVRP